MKILTDHATAELEQAPLKQLVVVITTATQLLLTVHLMELTPCTLSAREC